MLPEWRERLAPIAALSKPRILEIGAFEGRTTRWLLETFPDAAVTVVEPFTGGSDQGALQLSGLSDRFTANLGALGARVALLPHRSTVALPVLLAAAARFEFIYVDGSHEASDVIFDAVCAYHLCVPGGRICFDDYTWSHDAIPAQFTPKVAIDACVALHADLVRRLGTPGRQFWIEKNGRLA
jgi:predicted O-methyltransferase YrrM